MNTDDIPYQRLLTLYERALITIGDEHHLYREEVEESLQDDKWWDNRRRDPVMEPEDAWEEYPHA